jgi:hypothetical protein
MATNRQHILPGCYIGVDINLKSRRIPKMSAGEFLKARYQASYQQNRIHPIRIQPETAQLTVGGVVNALPADAINTPISALVGRGRRSRGLIVRTVTIKAPTDTPPAGYQPGGLTTIPCLTEEFFNACDAADSTTEVIYLDTPGYRVSYVSAEITK